MWSTFTDTHTTLLGILPTNRRTHTTYKERYPDLGIHRTTETHATLLGTQKVYVGTQHTLSYVKTERHMRNQRHHNPPKHTDHTPGHVHAHTLSHAHTFRCWHSSNLPDSGQDPGDQVGRPQPHHSRMHAAPHPPSAMQTAAPRGREMAFREGWLGRQWFPVPDRHRKPASSG